MKIYLMSGSSRPSGALDIVDGFISKMHVYNGSYKLSDMGVRGKKVMVVDDDVDDRNDFARWIGRLDADVYPFSSASDALKHYAEINPDVVLTDMQMPGMNGIEFAKEIKNRYSGVTS